MHTHIFVKLVIFVCFLLSSTAMFFVHCMLKILRYKKYFVILMSRLLHSTVHQMM